MLTISMLFVIKVFVTVLISMFLGLTILWPVNDQPVSKSQWIFFLCAVALLISLMFGFISFDFVK